VTPVGKHAGWADDQRWRVQRSRFAIFSVAIAFQIVSTLFSNKAIA
jgi:hypothetical protein